MEAARGATDEAGSALRRWGPVAAIVVVVVAVIGFLALGGGDDDDDPETAAATPTAEASDDTGGADDGSANDTGGTDDGSADDSAATDDGGADDGGTDGDVETGLPDGVMSYSRAAELGIDDTIDWGQRCDLETGRVRIPNFFAPDCYAPFDGDNGGATAPGVTADTIRVVYYVAQENDFIIQYVTDAIVNDDTNADLEDTMLGLIAYYETYYETYGRSVELIVFEASGLTTDPISARADAVAIAEELDPFMVWGGPALTNAFAEELAAREIPCFGCGPGQPHEFYENNSPYSWGLGIGSEQINLLNAEFVGKQLAGQPAEYAGDADLQSTERVFGRLWIESSEQSVVLNEIYEGNLAEFGVEVEVSFSYQLDPNTIQESAAAAIARMKAAGVTTILLTGDPVAPRDFAAEATSQDYFPEWVLQGSVLMDTNVFARTYDQDQWSNAFGVTSLSARVSQDFAGPRFRYNWFYGEEPAAVDTIGVQDPLPALFYATIQGTGPDLTAANMEEALFAADPTARAKTAVSISFGEQDRWPAEFEPDWRGVDDMTLVWWNPNEPGEDELGRDGDGMYMFVDDGSRYLLGEVPDDPIAIFDSGNSLSVYNERPADEPVPEYDPLPVG